MYQLVRMYYNKEIHLYEQEKELTVETSNDYTALDVVAQLLNNYGNMEGVEWDVRSMEG